MAATQGTSEPCVAHKQHRPLATGQEEHHVIPQAFQGFWHPAGVSLEINGVPTVGMTSLARPGEIVRLAVGLWDRRTVALCPTGHRNVHHWLVKAMHAWEADPEPTLDRAWDLVLRFARKDGIRPNEAEVAIARLGMQRWLEAGGDLLALCKVGLYGSA